MKRMKKARCADCRHYRFHTGELFIQRLPGTAPMEAREFYKEVSAIGRYECYLSLTTVGDLLGVKIREDEIVKFDDGSLPVFLCG